ncbi:hypothetical protein LPB19_12005 [Marinobacter salinisoli]|uniref:Sugar ABC transporter n=1 Tax=Marinobacter salinisoli TaxID=2769486 RepID=A0ABX7MQY1_9GAMM|nr:ABC transporter substrate binding protein [Marinobacter salinisoli]QSP93917.1 hypothetical protein LPB19_12005 [Marinobacter salinisoli]
MRVFLLALLLVSPLCFGKTVVVVQSYHLEYKWDADYLEAIQTVLGKEHDIHAFELDTKRLPKSEWFGRASDIRRSIAELGPDVVILGDDNAFALMAEPLVHQGIPVVFLGVNGGPAQHPALKHPLVTGILERPFFTESIRHLKKILRKKDRFLVLMDDSPTMRNAVTEHFGDKREAKVHGAQLEIVLTNNKSEWLSQIIQGHQTYDAIVVGTHHTIRDDAGNYAPPNELMDEAFAKAQIPIFSFWDIFVGKNQGIGGFTVSAHQEGLTAARLASLVLNGIAPGRIPQLKSLSGHYVYSQSGLQHWDLTLSPMIASQAKFVE